MKNFQENIAPNILSLAIMEMLRMKKGEIFVPIEVVKWIYPSSWEHFVDDVMQQMMLLYREGKISVTQNGIPISTQEFPDEMVEIGQIV